MSKPLKETAIGKAYKEAGLEGRPPKDDGSKLKKLHDAQVPLTGWNPMPKGADGVSDIGKALDHAFHEHARSERTHGAANGRKAMKAMPPDALSGRRENGLLQGIRRRAERDKEMIKIVECFLAKQRDSSRVPLAVDRVPLAVEVAKWHLATLKLDRSLRGLIKSLREARKDGKPIAT